MNIVIDQGNTTAKVGIFDHQTLLKKAAFEKSDELKDFVKVNQPEHLLISSVQQNASELLNAFEVSGRKLVLDHTLPVPIYNHYATPATLGVDRLAGVCGAVSLFPGNHCLVIDAGTCITYDFINKDRQFKGGGISPGMKMRFQAVHTFTAKLPLILPKPNAPLIGSTTEECIQSGIVNGIVAEMDGIVHQYAQEFDNLKVILCGGDARFFENQLKASIFASPELVLVGLNSILTHNVSL